MKTQGQTEMATSAIRFYESRSLLSKVSDIEAREARLRQNKLPLQACSRRRSPTPTRCRARRTPPGYWPAWAYCRQGSPEPGTIGLARCALCGSASPPPLVTKRIALAIDKASRCRRRPRPSQPRALVSGNLLILNRIYPVWRFAKSCHWLTCLPHRQPWRGNVHGTPRLEECRRVTICSVSMARFIGTR